MSVRRVVSYGNLWKCCTGTWKHATRLSEGVPSRALNTTPALCLNHFQRRKILGEFTTLYDRNNDGFVDVEDIEMYKSTLQHHYARTRGKYMHDSMPAYEDYWILFKDLADSNKDGKLSQEEWLDIWTQISTGRTNGTFLDLPQWVRLMPPIVFSIMDYKGDGVIDEDEYKLFWYEVGRIGANNQVIEKCVRTMTEDGKYEFNRDRFENLYADFYLSEDSSSPGKYMAGPVDY